MLSRLVSVCHPRPGRRPPCRRGSPRCPVPWPSSFRCTRRGFSSRPSHLGTRLAVDPPIAMHVTAVIIISIKNVIPCFRSKRCRVAVRPRINRRLRLRLLLRSTLRGFLRGFVLRRAVGVADIPMPLPACLVGLCGRLSRPPCGGLVSRPAMESHHGARSGVWRRIPRVGHWPRPKTRNPSRIRWGR